MYLKSFQLIVISPPENKTDEISILKSLFNSGLQTFHIRKPGFTIYEFEKYIQQIPKEHYSKIIIHDQYELAVKYDLKGIHLTEKTKKNMLDDSFCNQFQNKLISASFHNFEDIQKESEKYDYVFFSPVFKSISKENYSPIYSLDEIKKFILLNKVSENNLPPLIALGGVEKENIYQIISSGFAGGAMLGAIWENNDPVKTFQEIYSEIK